MSEAIFRNFCSVVLISASMVTLGCDRTVDTGDTLSSTGEELTNVSIESELDSEVGQTPTGEVPTGFIESKEIFFPTDSAEPDSITGTDDFNSRNCTASRNNTKPLFSPPR